MRLIIAMLMVSCGPIGFDRANANEERELGDAIEQFNFEAKNDPIGSTQQPLSEQEVIAAIRFWNDPDAQVSVETLATFKKIAETGLIPENAGFEKLTGYDRGGEHIFDVWSVRIRIERPDKSSYGFILRETVVSSRTLQEELDRIKASTGQFPNGDRMPGWHRIESRIRELEQRIVDSQTAR